MNSRMCLHITDPSLEIAYLRKRNRDISIISSLIVIVRIMMLIGAIISQFTNNREMAYESWVVRGVTICYHAVIILIGRNRPKPFCELHTVLVIPITLINLTHVAFVPKTDAALLNNIANYMLFMVVGLLCNGKWLYTSVMILVSNAGTLLFYGLYLDVHDAQLVIGMTAISLLICYSAYHVESIQKHEYL